MFKGHTLVFSKVYFSMTFSTKRDLFSINLGGELVKLVKFGVDSTDVFNVMHFNLLLIVTVRTSLAKGTYFGYFSNLR